MDEYCENEIKEFLRKLQRYKESIIFLQPVEDIIKEIPIYKEKIPHPIDLLKIIQKFKSSQYNSLLEIKADIDLMISNCFTFNTEPNSFVVKKCTNFRDYYASNWDKLYSKIEKRNEKKKSFLNQKRLRDKEEHNNTMHANSKQNILEKNDNVAILLYEDEKIEKRIRSLFDGFKTEMDLNEEELEKLMQNLIKSISKRNKTFDQIYENFNRIVMKHLKANELKSKFAKKFKKLFRTLEEEQNEENQKMDSKTLNIKIDLNENEQKREEKRKLELIKKDLKYFVENQKVPDVYLDPGEYSIDPALKKKIYSHVCGIREKLSMGQKVESNDLDDL